MLDIKFIRENQAAVEKAIADKRVDIDLPRLLVLDDKRIVIEREMQELQAAKNKISESIPAAADKAPLVAESRELGVKIAALESKMGEFAPELERLLWLVPNIPAHDVPVGIDDSQNVEIKRVGDKTKFDFEPMSHYDLLIKNDWADFERVAKVCGSRAHCLKGAAARYELALNLYVMDKLADKGFTMMSVPSVLNGDAPLYGTGHFPFGREDVYKLGHMEADGFVADNTWLAGTCELVLNSLHSGEMIPEDQLPILYAGFSPCFRREAGAAGKDTRGLIRVHQFNKTEQYVLCKADMAEQKKWFDTMLATGEEVLADLELPYRLLETCTGDMGAGKYRMVDLEAWLPTQNRYVETHSCSALTDWQARRTGLRYRENGTNKVRHCFTLNNTGIATPRIFAMLLENHQTADGRVRIPEKLRAYMGGREYL
ncbi:MAG: serine--tRNA ligase [Alphaproteobacteria bacterium]|nr:serine--tRNA ligase [Alphaproteobacteria bacterium]